MSIYKVELCINVSGYEKYITHYVAENDPVKAAYVALCDETHNEKLSYEDFLNPDIPWEDDIFLYTVYSIKEVSNFPQD